MKIRPLAQWAIRILALVVFGIFSTATAWFPGHDADQSASYLEIINQPLILERILPSFSFFAVMMGMLARREWVLSSLWLIPPLLVLILTFWKGTWFCRWICPLGTLQTAESRISIKRTILKRNLGGYIVFACLIGALLGFPLFMIFDPLAISSRVIPAFLHNRSLYEWLALSSIGLILILGFIQPFLWCIRICPFGYLQRLLHRLRFVCTCKEDACTGFKPVRRELLLGAVLGIPTALLLKRFGFSHETPEPPLLPPGAKDSTTFASTCTRCYACVNACSTKVLQVSTGKRADFMRAMEPELNFESGLVCAYGCNNCSHACPTAALAPLTLKEKRKRQIGIARVSRETCMGWADDIDCMACSNQCPFGAIDSDVSEHGVPRPVVNPDRCRGCGYCQAVCPIEGKAIHVHGVKKQRQLAD